MDVACQLVCCGVDPIRRTSLSSSFINTTTTSHHRSFPSTIRIRRRNGVVRAVATEPKPTDTGPSRSPPKVVNGSPRSSPPKAVNGASTRMENVSKEIKRVRAQMEENEQLAILMKGLRGQNLRDSQFADDNIQLRLVEVCLLFLMHIHTGWCEILLTLKGCFTFVKC
ncbi:uncharacterized protein LOC114288605 [Camellia sinensis]|uniref:uncharacterized protein LOC114288605 n=1 Tax=Camellia sinensis TaxID=4442 RepID=UPI00103578E5|nr:uncharacterized protein LOC114288605 [Camellia sinensis]XP_028087934.1 uncharacterized protein LOC114288605 [Camellia sinensis]